MSRRKKKKDENGKNLQNCPACWQRSFDGKECEHCGFEKPQEEKKETGTMENATNGEVEVSEEDIVEEKKVEPTNGLLQMNVNGPENVDERSTLGYGEKPKVVTGQHNVVPLNSEEVESLFSTSPESATPEDLTVAPPHEPSSFATFTPLKADQTAETPFWEAKTNSGLVGELSDSSAESEESQNASSPSGKEQPGVTELETENCKPVRGAPRPAEEGLNQEYFFGTLDDETTPDSKIPSESRGHMFLRGVTRWVARGLILVVLAGLSAMLLLGHSTGNQAVLTVVMAFILALSAALAPREKGLGLKRGVKDFTSYDDSPEPKEKRIWWSTALIFSTVIGWFAVGPLKTVGLDGFLQTRLVWALGASACLIFVIFLLLAWWKQEDTMVYGSAWTPLETARLENRANFLNAAWTALSWLAVLVFVYLVNLLKWPWAQGKLGSVYNYAVLIFLSSVVVQAALWIAGKKKVEVEAAKESRDERNAKNRLLRDTAMEQSGSHKAFSPADVNLSSTDPMAPRFGETPDIIEKAPWPRWVHDVVVLGVFFLGLYGGKSYSERNLFWFTAKKSAPITSASMQESGSRNVQMNRDDLQRIKTAVAELKKLILGNGSTQRPGQGSILDLISDAQIELRVLKSSTPSSVQVNRRVDTLDAEYQRRMKELENRLTVLTQELEAANKKNTALEGTVRKLEGEVVMLKQKPKPTAPVIRPAPPVVPRVPVRPRDDVTDQM